MSRRRSELRVTAEPRGLFVLEGGPSTGEFRIENSGRDDAEVKLELSVPRGFRARTKHQHVRVPGQGSVRVPVEVRLENPEMPRGTLTLHADDAYDWKSMIATDDWVRVASMSASSSHTSAWLGWKPVQASNGLTFDDWAWGPIMAWNDGTPNEFPDWLRATWQDPVKLSRVRVITRDSPSAPAKEKGLRDYDVEVLARTEWQRVAQVRGNVEGVVSSTFAPVTTTAVRIMIFASNDGRYSRVSELEAYGPKGRPTPDLYKRYGGPGGIYPLRS